MDATEGVAFDPELASRLDAALVGVDGRIGVAVKDLGTGRGALLNADRELPSASLFKLPVLYTVFQAELPLTEQLLITEDIKSFDLGTLELGAGETLSVAEALERMVTLSDNVSAILLATRVGGARVNADSASLGMRRTHYSADRLTTSAGDMLNLLERIARGTAVSRTASADMLHLLLRQRVNDRLPRLLPDEASVAHKTGNLPGIINDVGVIYGPRSTTIIAGLIADTADEDGAALGLARVAQVAYSYFEAQPEAIDRPRILPAPARPIPPAWREPRPPTPTPARLPPTAPPARAGVVGPTPTAEATEVAPSSASTRLQPAPTPLPAATAGPAAAVAATQVATPTATAARPASPTPAATHAATATPRQASPVPTMAATATPPRGQPPR
jgi:beta-lactamase class A